VNLRESEEALGNILKFRVTMVGNRKLEFLAHFGEGDQQMLRVKSTRPATQQEGEMWDYMLKLMGQLTDVGGEAGRPEAGLDAHKVRDSLGNPKDAAPRSRGAYGGHSVPRWSE
jgi:hypothetical protein